MEEKTCPVCGKPVGDYLKENIRCGSCGSNLEVYRLLGRVDQEVAEKGLRWKPVAIASMIAAIIFALLYLFTPKSSGEAADCELLAELQDSVNMLNKRLNESVPVAAVKTDVAEKKAEAKVEEKTEVNKEEKEEEKITDEKAEKKEEPKADMSKVVVRNGKKYYTVEQGDSWWKICKKVYGAGKMDYKEIAKLNGKPLDYKMKVGEEIQVK
jgi:hypothetical protein